MGRRHRTLRGFRRQAPVNFAIVPPPTLRPGARAHFLNHFSQGVAPMSTKLRPVIPPKLVAIATDKVVKPTNAFPDPTYLPLGPVPKYGQDFTFGTSAKRLGTVFASVGTTEAELKPKMEKLLSIFASADQSGMAKRLFTKFLAKQTSVIYFDDPDLNRAASAHPNIKFFCGAALSAPNTPYQAAGKVRIHQALKQANWDVKKVIAPADLGVPAFNTGSKLWSTGDFANGLGLMINGVQHVFVLATAYDYDASSSQYSITLKFLFYDVFGLDDEDLKDFGARSDGKLTPASKVGITAWWQLQHEHGYAPLVTRIVLEETYDVPAV
jgi:hypothetical protein